MPATAWHVLDMNPTENELEKFVKSNQVNLFSAHLSHLEPLCATGEAVSLKVSQCYLLAKCLSEGKWNWPFIYYVTNNWVGRFRKWNVLLTNIHKSSLYSRVEFWLLQKKNSKSLSWSKDLNKLFTVLGGKFKFSVEDSDLEYLFWRSKNHPFSSDIKPSFRQLGQKKAQNLLLVIYGRVHFLLRFFSPSQIHLRFNTEKPSQLLLKCEKVCILKSP